MAKGRDVQERRKKVRREKGRHRKEEVGGIECGRNKGREDRKA